TDANMEEVLRQLEGFPKLTGDDLGRGFVMFSPSFVAHLMEEAEGIERCPKNIPAAEAPPSPDNFSPCIQEFPRSAVMVKTNWQRLDNPVTYHDTDPATMKHVIDRGTWDGQKEAIPGDDEIYKVVTAEGTEYGLAGIHFSTKDTREWVWVSLWWHPQSRLDYGEDRPVSLSSFNNGVWDHYKMCVTTSFREGDPAPGSHYEGSRPSLAEALTATHGALDTQLVDGGSVAGLPWPPPLTPGPWESPHDQVTTWCSNPNLEGHPGNGRTNCIGCHQFPNTRNEIRNQDNAFWETLAGDYPQYGRDLFRRNFPADFAWSFYYELTDRGPSARGVIREAREKAGYEWPEEGP
ncbi:MAG: hypothetical protein MI919_40160, partial [Holophagales bacterium]|nr:hypothetical protein [Holophagales bacterium]